MKNTRHGWLSAAQGAGWFRLDRHDDPEPDPASEPDPDPAGDPDPAPADSEPEPDADPEGADKLGDAGKRALDAMKAERAAAKKEAAAAKKAAADALKRVQEFEDRDKSELDKATSRAEKATQRAEQAANRAVRAEVKAAAKEFADAEDAVAFLDLTSYTDDDGEIDTESIATDLEALLERKPHLRKQEAPKQPERKAPKPDPGQGARPASPPNDYRTADRRDVDAELAKYGVKLRR